MNTFRNNRSFAMNTFPQNRSFIMNTFQQIVLWLHTSLAPINFREDAQTQNSLEGYTHRLRCR